jgi:hypothetical protein
MGGFLRSFLRSSWGPFSVVKERWAASACATFVIGWRVNFLCASGLEWVRQGCGRLRGRGARATLNHTGHTNHTESHHTFLFAID